jgi:hypothetical protein
MESAVVRTTDIAARETVSVKDERESLAVRVTDIAARTMDSVKDPSESAEVRAAVKTRLTDSVMDPSV